MLSVLNLKKHLNPFTLHHAYLLVGDHAAIVPGLLAFIEQELKMRAQGNPDLLQATHDTFGVDDARELARAALRRSLGGRAVFVLTVRSFTHEAQNALLKLIEEPIPGTHFFFIVPNTATLLPTLLSRFVVVPVTASTLEGGDSSLVDASSAAAEKFLAAAPHARLKIVGKMIEEKNIEEATNFFNTLERTLFQRGEFRKSHPHQRFLKELIRARTFLNSRSPSLKIILEHIALTAPLDI